MRPTHLISLFLARSSSHWFRQFLPYYYSRGFVNWTIAATCEVRTAKKPRSACGDEVGCYCFSCLCSYESAMLTLPMRWFQLSVVFVACRICELNKSYALCASYPSLLVVPASVTDVEIEAVSQFRSEQRLSVLCWGRKTDSASIWRSSQPKVLRLQ